MKLFNFFLSKKIFVTIFIFAMSFSVFSQNQSPTIKQPSEFWKHVQFGGGIGLGFGNGYTDIGIAPSAIYNVNEIFAIGTGLQFSYASSKNYYNNFVYGVNGIILVSPLPQVQFSIGLNQSKVNYSFNAVGDIPSYSQDYWVTSMIVGIGYRSGNVTVGIGYNILNNDPYYDTDPIVPFVRAYF